MKGKLIKDKKRETEGEKEKKIFHSIPMEQH